MIQHHLLNVEEYSYGDYVIRLRNDQWYWYPKGNENRAKRCTNVEACVAMIEMQLEDEPCEPANYVTSPPPQDVPCHPSITDSDAFLRFNRALGRLDESDTLIALRALMDMLIDLEEKVQAGT